MQARAFRHVRIVFYPDRSSEYKDFKLFGLLRSSRLFHKRKGKRRPKRIFFIMAAARAFDDFIEAAATVNH